MTHSPDPNLLQRYVDRRDEAAFSELVARHGGMVRAVARRLAPLDADDVTQAVFLLLSQRAGSLAKRRTLAGWLHETARLVSANARRARSREASRLDAARVQTAALQARRENPMAAAHSVVSFDIDDALAALPADQRSALLLRYVEGLSLEEAAASLAVSPATVAKRAQRALERLRRVLGPGGVEVGAVAAPPLSGAEVQTISHAALFKSTSPGAQGLAAGTRISLVPVSVRAIAAGALIVVTLAASGVAYSHRSRVASQPPSATTQQWASARDGATATVQAFLQALRGRDIQGVAAQLAEPDGRSRERLAQTYVRDLRDGAFGQYPERLALGAGNSLELDRTGLPLAASFESASPTDADLGVVVVRLQAAGARWRVVSATLSAEGASYSGPKLDLAAPAPQDRSGSGLSEAVERIWLVVATFDPATLNEGNKTDVLTGLRKAEVEATRAIERMGGAVAKDAADLVTLRDALKRAADALAAGGMEGFGRQIEMERTNAALMGAIGRHQAAMETAKRAADAREEASHSASRPASVEGDVPITLQWSGRTVNLPGPLKFPEWLRGTRAFVEWQKVRSVQTFRTRDDAGNLYEVACQGVLRNAEGFERPIVSSIRQYRGDGTLAATTELSWEGRLSSWSRIDATGKRCVFRAMQDGRGLHLVHFYLPAGDLQRTWELRKDGRTAWYDYVEDAIGRGRRQVHLANEEGRELGDSIPDPGLGGLPVR